MQGITTTDGALAATSLYDVKDIFVFTEGSDQRIYLNQVVYGQAFSGWAEVQGNGRTDAAPAATSLNSVNAIFALGKRGDSLVVIL